MMSFHVGSLGFLTHFVYENHQQDIRRVIEGMLSILYLHTQCFTRDSLKEARTIPFNCTLHLLKPMILELYTFS